MSPAKHGQMAVPRSGAFAAAGTTEAVTGGSVLDDVVAGAVAATAGAEPEMATAPPAAKAPRKAGRRKTSKLPMPDRIAAADADVPLQVKVPRALHWDFKVAALTQGSDMTRAATALLTVYTEDPELLEVLMDIAARAGRSLGDLIHDALVDVAAGQTEG